MEELGSVLYTPVRGLNAWDVLTTYNPNLIPVLEKNLDICDFLAGVFKHIVEAMAYKGISYKGMKIGLVCMESSVLKIFLECPPNLHSSASKPDNRILWDRNPLVARMLTVNSSVRDLAVKVTSTLEQWARDKGVAFEDIRLEHGRLVRGGMIMISDVTTKQAVANSLEAKSDFLSLGGEGGVVQNADVS